MVGAPESSPTAVLPKPLRSRSSASSSPTPGPRARPVRRSDKLGTVDAVEFAENGPGARSGCRAPRRGAAVQALRLARGQLQGRQRSGAGLLPFVGIAPAVESIPFGRVRPLCCPDLQHTEPSARPPHCLLPLRAPSSRAPECRLCRPLHRIVHGRALLARLRCPPGSDAARPRGHLDLREHATVFLMHRPFDAALGSDGFDANHLWPVARWQSYSGSCAGAVLCGRASWHRGGGAARRRPPSGPAADALRCGRWATRGRPR